MTATTTQFLILSTSLGVTMILGLWKAGVIQRAVDRLSLRLPKWAQPIPPIVLASILQVITTIRLDAPLDTATAVRSGMSGVLAIGLYHLAKRWLPAWIKTLIKVSSPTAIMFWIACAVAGSSSVIACSLLGGKPASSLPEDRKEAIAMARNAVSFSRGLVELTLLSDLDEAQKAAWEDRLDLIMDVEEQIGNVDATADQVCAQVDRVVPLLPALECPQCTAAVMLAQDRVCNGS